MPHDDESLDPCCGPGEGPFSAVVADSILDDKMAAPDEHPNPKAVNDAHASVWEE